VHEPKAHGLINKINGSMLVGLANVKRIFVTILLCLGVSHVSGYIDILIW
jgi:hypothetical protein